MRAAAADLLALIGSSIVFLNAFERFRSPENRDIYHTRALLYFIHTKWARGSISFTHVTRIAETQPRSRDGPGRGPCRLSPGSVAAPS